jgi:hypothetical protein
MAASDHEPRHKEAYIRLEQLLDRKAMPLMRLVDCTKHGIQFSDQVMHFGGCFSRSFDREAHRVSSTDQSARAR